MLDSKYTELIKYYEANKDRPWNEWLEFDTMFEKPGKQGQVGILKSKDGKLKYIFKISQTMNYLVYHELTVMRGLNILNDFCPHFCKGIGSIVCNLEPDLKARNPFRVKSKYPIEKEVLLSEYIDKSSKFCSYINSPKVPENILYSITKQVLNAINIAQKCTLFSHYDLHSNNIMIKKCFSDLVFLYKIDDENQYCVPSYGYYPVIIDFGFSYIGYMEQGPLWTSLAYTDTGFMSDRFDWVADPKLFLVTVSDEIKTSRETKKSRALRNIAKNIFSKLSIDMSSGWDDDTSKCAVDYIFDELDTSQHKSKIFKNYEYICFDVLQSLIILPLEDQNSGSIQKAYDIFLNEWVKIENVISSEYYNLYILKELISCAREVRGDYECENHTKAVGDFRRGIHDIIAKVSKFCVITDVHFERMLCSLYLLTKCMEGILYRVMKERMSDKIEEYDKMPIGSVEEIYGIVEANIPDDYTYNTNTTFLIMDVDERKYKIFNIPDDEIDNINSLETLYRGTYVYDLYIQSQKNENIS